jgi:hypothetical protein
VLEDVPQPQRAELLEQQHPRTEGAGDASGQQTRSRHEVEAERAEARNRRGGRRSPLPADYENLVPLGAVEDDRHLAARPVQVGLDDLERQPRGDRGVEGVAAQLEDRHARGRGEPVGRRDHPERAP